MKCKVMIAGLNAAVDCVRTTLQRKRKEQKFQVCIKAVEEVDLRY